MTPASANPIACPRSAVCVCHGPQPEDFGVDFSVIFVLSIRNQQVLEYKKLRIHGSVSGTLDGRASQRNRVTRLHA